MNYLTNNTLVSSYLWLSVIVWTTAIAQAVRLKDHRHVLIFRCVMAAVPALCLAWMAAA